MSLFRAKEELLQTRMKKFWLYFDKVFRQTIYNNLEFTITGKKKQGFRQSPKYGTHTKAIYNHEQWIKQVTMKYNQMRDKLQLLDLIRNY